MLRGELISLRARAEADVAILDTELHDDVTTFVRTDTRPWRPVPAGSEHSSYRVREAAAKEAAFFSVVELASGELAGSAAVWGIDQHNRFAHLGMSLRPSFRGRRLSTDVLRVLCYYGFSVLGLNRLQLETLADNAPMIAAASRAGFVLEGQLRASGWVNGAFADEVILGQLASEWQNDQARNA